VASSCVIRSTVVAAAKWVKDHETGRRRRFERPPEEWVRQHDESLRIVAEAAWQRVQATAKGRGQLPSTGAGSRATSRL